MEFISCHINTPFLFSTILTFNFKNHKTRR
nr:MAG TPA: hypothetical protein [Caudoviricetes sp.]